MFETFLSVPLHFTIEFLGFLVAVGGALLVLSRPDLVPGHLSNRISVALGLGVYAAAQVLHGGAFQFGDVVFGNEGEPLLVAARALAFALILIGVVGARPAGASAIVGYNLNEPLLLAPVGAALLVSFAALSVSRKEGAGVYRRLAAASFFLALGELLTGASPDTSEYVGRAFDRFSYTAHALKFVGFALLASWFWSGVRSSIRTRFVASFGALLVIVILALSTALTGVISNSVETEELRQVTAQAESAARSIQERAGELSEVAENIAALSAVQDRMGSNPKRLAADIRKSPVVPNEIDFVIVDPAKLVPGASGHGPRLEVDEDPVKLTLRDQLAILGTDVAEEVRGGADSSASPTRIGDAVVVIAASDVRGPDGEVAGSVIVGDFVDALSVEAISEAVQAPASLVVRKKVVASELPRSAVKGFSIPPDVRSAIAAGGSANARQRLGETYFSGFATVEGGAEPVATLVISSPSRLVSGTREDVTRILFAAAMLVGSIALVLAWLSGRRITRPIQQLTTTAGAVREGDLTAQVDIVGNDEVGQLGETFNEMTASLLKMTSDLREAAREEHTLRARIETIIQSMADGLVAVDADRNVLAFNREAEHLTGVAQEEAVGRAVEEVLRAVDQQSTPVTLPIYSLADGAVGGVFLQRDDADPVPVAVTSAVLTNEAGDVAGGVAVVRDMTREREVERMKTEFLSNISHELRTPLTPIKGYAEILQRKELPPDKVKQFVGGILDSTARLERIVALLVDFSAMEAGRMAPRSTHVDLSEMVRKLAEDWGAKAQGHEVIADLAEGLPEVLGDERLLRRSVEEVLDNAVKFSPNGGTICVTARGIGSRNGNGSARSVEITISDEGIGISEQDLPKIFSDFHQLDGSETRTFGGLGLGLAFVQRIVEAHEGSLRVESVP